MRTVREVTDYIKSNHYDINPFNFSKAASLIFKTLEPDEEILFACSPYTALYQTRERKDGRWVQSEITDFGHGILVITNLHTIYVKNNKLFRKPVIAAKESMWHFLEAESPIIEDTLSAIFLSFRASNISICIPTEKREEMWKAVVYAIEHSEHKTRVEGLKKFAELFGVPSDKPEGQTEHEEAVNKSLRELRDMIR